MLSERIWVYNDFKTDDVEILAKEAGVSPLLAKILLCRGMRSLDEINRFLYPSLEDLNDPFLLKGMEEAVARLSVAIEQREKVLIFGDYDVDGVTSTSILFDFLLKQGLNVEFYIPDRLEEGYGLSIAAVDKAMRLKPSLVITVDCGITAIEEVKYIRNSGIDIIITDHHECKDELPDACAVVNPHRPDCIYPFKELAGVGVVYKLISAVCERLKLGEIFLDYLELTAVGTIADVVPLIDENRVIVKHGLSRIENSLNLGLKTLIENSGLKDKKVTSWSVSYVLAPRINAAGRTGDAGRAVRLFTTNDNGEALDIVQELNEENRFRQETEAEILQQAVNIIDTGMDLDREKVIVVAGEGWHHGVVGIVASKITEKYYRPCILFSSDGDISKGSGRSVEGFNLFKAISHCESLLERFGGHELAAGLSIKTENLQRFREMINKYADSVMRPEDMIPKVKIDVPIKKGDISANSVREIDILAPFGAGNPSPVFSFNGLKVNDIKTVGDSKHLKLRLEDNGFFVDAIGFNMGYMYNDLCSMDTLNAACSMEINTWNSVDRVQLNLKDLKLDSEVDISEKYYFSLDKCLGFHIIDGIRGMQKLIDNSNMMQSREQIEKKIYENVSSGKRVAVLVNSIEGIGQVEAMLRKYSAGIKKLYNICYTGFGNKNIDLVQVIVNPDPEAVNFELFNLVVFYGGWVHKAYLNALVSKIGREKACFHSNNDTTLNVDEIVPGRQDLVAIFQYIKSGFENPLFIENLFTFARQVANSYKINMNYFKLKKGLDILEEVNVLSIRPVDKNSVYISIVDRGKEKANLENSELYRKLQALKTNFIEAN